MGARLSHRRNNSTCFTRILLLVLWIVCSTTIPGETIEAGNSEPRAGLIEGGGGIHLSEAQQKMAGIATQIVQPTAYLPESRAFGKVLALDPLLQIAQQLRLAASEKKVAAAALTAAKTAYSQVQGLYDDQAIPRLKLDQARTDWIRAKASYDQAVAKAEAFRNGAIQNWGKVLTQWISNPASADFRNLLHRKSALLLISLPAGATFPDEVDHVFVNRSAERTEARTAQMISIAPVTGASTQGESYFFRSSSQGLRTGMHLYVWIPTPGEARKGIEVPSNALVWRDGRPWIYLKTARDSFDRYPVENASDQSDRWFMAETPDHHAEIVITGGQTLLSREFHWQIPEEDED